MSETIIIINNYLDLSINLEAIEEIISIKILRATNSMLKNNFTFIKLIKPNLTTSRMTKHVFNKTSFALPYQQKVYKTIDNSIPYSIDMQHI